MRLKVLLKEKKFVLTLKKMRVLLRGNKNFQTLLQKCNGGTQVVKKFKE